MIAITSPDREISHSDVERVVEASRVIVLPPEREMIHAIPRGYVVDGQDGVKDPVGMSGTRLEVETHIVTGSTAFLDNVVKCVRRAGLEIDTTVLEPIATGESAVLPAEKDLGVVLIDIGGGTTDVAVFVERRDILHRRAAGWRQPCDQGYGHRASRVPGRSRVREAQVWLRRPAIWWIWTTRSG